MLGVAAVAAIVLLADTCAGQSTASRRHAGPSKPAIYIYDLPQSFQNGTRVRSLELYDWWGYGSEKRIPEMLELAGHRTLDAETADYFLVPAWIYGISHQPYIRELEYEDMEYPPPELLAIRAVLDYIRDKWPHWDAKGGKDHIWTMSADHGFCGLSMAGPTPGMISSSVILTQWGLMNFETHCEVEDRIMNFGDCGDRKLIKQMAAKGQVRLDRLPCFNPYKDIAVPSPAWDHDESAGPRREMQEEDEVYTEDGRLVMDVMSDVKNHTLFFVGGARWDTPDYSHGVRQTLFRLFNDTPGFRLVEKKGGDNPLSHKAMMREMGRSHFCLAPAGDGYETRLKLAVNVGCIPLVIQDEIQVAFEDVLPYKDFAIRLGQHMLYRLPEILGDLLSQKREHADKPMLVEAMRRRLSCASQFLNWHAEGRAVEALACSLLKRLHGDAVRPEMNWDRCQLHCEVPPTKTSPV
ncbi:hypothetical protein WJX73_003049 [Symbiochloris irregularis]|uniref:Exostosin GT47 domain-containing protein n=1 Tax=Symbiochloris irregularis TaxID=706552 RepID=A0AAW1PE10_9CHLO